MRYLYTDQEAKAIDRHAIGEMAMPALILMEKAAMSVAALIMEKKSRETKILFVCGTGNNGGDGVAAARILWEQGYDVTITVIGAADRMTDSMKTQMEIAANCDVPLVFQDEMKTQQFDLIVDGIFGVGLSRDVEGVPAQIIQWINQKRRHAEVLSLDLPSGISGATGKVMGIAVQADATITFGVNKIGLVVHPGCAYAGEVVIADIGFPRKSVMSVQASTYHYEMDDLMMKMPRRKAYSNKGSYGKVLVVAGSENMTGACYLAAKATYSMGAGLVKVCTPRCNRDVILTALPEVLYSDVDELEEGLKWADVVILGPGLGRDKKAEETVECVLTHVTCPLVIDGDGLYWAGKCKERIPKETILTPHLKELSAFSDIPIQEIQNNLLQTARSLAEKYSCILVEKDAKTIVSDGVETYVNVSGNNGMATGGSGDVLAGIIGGLLAGGAEPFEAAKLGCYLHGLSGDRAREKKSAYSMLASDLIDGMAEVLSELTE
ncbi:MAG: NAD(P)H-hydrate dehydratase [Eubacterium sp.]|nr:NAD(P)H-hydrate dehydratase [Eubacterium sp.]